MTTGPREQPRSSPASWIAAAIAAVVLLLDDFTPQEMPPQMLYVLCVLVSVWARHERTIWWVATMCSVLTVLGVLLGYPTFDPSIILFNRTTALVLIWLTAVLVWQYRRAHDQLVSLTRELEERVHDRTRELSLALEERERLNRDLHDKVLQSLYAVGLRLEARRPPGPDGTADPDEHIQQALHQLKLAMQEIRSFIAGRQPASEEDRALDRVLPSLVQSMTLEQGPEFRLTIEPGFTNGLSQGHAEAILMIVREALSNCVRHSRATHGWVRVRRRNGVLRVEVQDDGVGFHADAPWTSGQGLANMVARAKAIGAALEIRSAPGQGVQIALDLPLQPREGIHS